MRGLQQVANLRRKEDLEVIRQVQDGARQLLLALLSPPPVRPAEDGGVDQRAIAQGEAVGDLVGGGIKGIVSVHRVGRFGEGAVFDGLAWPDVVAEALFDEKIARNGGKDFVP